MSAFIGLRLSETVCMCKHIFTSDMSCEIHISELQFGRLIIPQLRSWIDVTYLSKSLRISRGNKGTLFILQRVPDDLMYDDPAAALAAATSMTNFQSGQKSKRIRANNLNVTVCLTF